MRRDLDSGKARDTGLVARGGEAAKVRTGMDIGLFHRVNVPVTLLNPAAGHPKPDRLVLDRDYENVIGVVHATGAGTASSVRSPAMF